MTVANFPNFFMLLGPSTLSGHVSAIYGVEGSVAHLIGLLSVLLDRIWNALTIFHFFSRWSSTA